MVKPQQQQKKKQQQQQFQQIQHVDAWKQRQLQQITVQNQFRKIASTKEGFPTIYVDKKTKEICLFHGTTTDSFPFFLEQRTILPKFFMTFDLKEALWYAHHRYNEKKRTRSQIFPGLLVFKIQNEKILNNFVYSDTHIVLKSDQDVRLLLANSIVEMITIKPSQQTNSTRSQRPISTLKSIFSRWTR